MQLLILWCRRIDVNGQGYGTDYLLPQFKAYEPLNILLTT